LNYDFPGNARELENIADYLCVSVVSDFINYEGLPEQIIKKCKEEYKEQIDIAYCKYVEQHLDKSHINLMDVYYILDLLIKEKRGGMGRYKMISIINKYNLNNISEGYLKRCQRVLSNLNLVSVGKTKQGTKITEKGIVFFEYLRIKMNDDMEILG